MVIGSVAFAALGIKIILDIISQAGKTQIGEDGTVPPLTGSDGAHSQSTPA